MSETDDRAAIDELAAVWFGGQPRGGVPPELIPLDEKLERLSGLGGHLATAGRDLQVAARRFATLARADG